MPQQQTPPPPKYKFVNGVMKLNEEYVVWQGNNGGGGSSAAPPPTVARPKEALAIVSSTNDIQAASDAQMQATGKEMKLSDATISSMQIMQDPEFLDKFKAPRGVDGGVLLDRLSEYFAKYEIPVGLVNKLLILTEYRLHFIVDDSGSMAASSDAPFSMACDVMKQMDTQRSQRGDRLMTRWEEAEDRLHVMMDMLSYIPTEEIVVTFLNRGDRLVFNHAGKQPETFAKDAHARIRMAFSKMPNGGTPINRVLTTVFSEAARQSHSTMIYLFTDGVPSDASTQQVATLVLNRARPEKTPLTFLSCTDTDQEAEWMKEIEERAPFTAELDDFDDERREVLHDQGPAFPFSRGMWLICQMVAAVCPHDLDALDECVPFTKQTMDNLLGRVLTVEEYNHYFQNHPMKSKFEHLIQQFRREDVKAMDIQGVAQIKQSISSASSVATSSSYY